MFKNIGSILLVLVLTLVVIHMIFKQEKLENKIKSLTKQNAICNLKNLKDKDLDETLENKYKK